MILLTWDVRSVFNDFGSNFTCVDPTGEQPLTGMIAEVDKVRLQPSQRATSHSIIG